MRAGDLQARVQCSYSWAMYSAVVVYTRVYGARQLLCSALRTCTVWVDFCTEISPHDFEYRCAFFGYPHLPSYLICIFCDVWSKVRVKSSLTFLNVISLAKLLNPYRIKKKIRPAGPPDYSGSGRALAVQALR